MFAGRLYEKQKRREQNRRYYQRLKQDPERFKRVMKKGPALGTKAPREALTRPGPHSVPHFFGESEQRDLECVRNRAADSDTSASPPKPGPAHGAGMERKRISESE